MGLGEVERQYSDPPALKARRDHYGYPDFSHGTNLRTSLNFFLLQSKSCDPAKAHILRETAQLDLRGTI